MLNTLRERKRTLAPERYEGSSLKRYICLRLSARSASVLTARAAPEVLLAAALNLQLSARRRRDAQHTLQLDEPGYHVVPAHILTAQRYTHPFLARGTSVL